MNTELLAALLARIDRLERLLCQNIDHRSAGWEFSCLRNQLYDECRMDSQPSDDDHRAAAARMLEQYGSKTDG